MTTPLTVTGIDHIVLQVPEVAPVVAWYRDELGLAVERLEEFEAGQAIFVTVRIDATTIIDVLPGERTGENVNHFAVVVAEDVDELAASGRFDVEIGPADLSGAQGQGRGIYIRDPAGNLVELRTYRG
ncbi:MAG TPA: VOC family protein [Iamia sp.]|jgi:catechol 2,3-dioxygenase-like lactoylglutathione lyase family enzyme|nr:VOC family protein [Iamia sp.]